MLNLFWILFIISNSYYNSLVISQNLAWHYFQIINIILLLFIGYIRESREKFIYQIISFALVYPFIFNVSLNLFRGLPINHLGAFDFLPFWATVLFFILGFILMLIIFLRQIYLDDKNLFESIENKSNE